MEWLGFVLFVGVVAYAAWQRFAPRPGVVTGRPPYPPIRVHVDRALQIVDLRGLPFPDGSQAALDFAHEALITMPPCQVRVWVLPEPILEAWLGLDGLAWAVVAGRLLDGRKQPGPSALWMPGATPEQEALVAAAGLTPVQELTGITPDGTAVTMDDRLGPVPAWPEGVPGRPCVPMTVHRTLLWVWVVQTDDAVFVDLRRATVAAVDSAGCGLAQAAGQLKNTEASRRRIWLVSPWMLDRWAPRQPEVVEAWTAALASGPRAAAEHIVVDGAGGDDAMLDALTGLGLGPLDGQLAVTRQGHTFHVPFPDVLRDAMLSAAWRDVQDRCAAREASG